MLQWMVKSYPEAGETADAVAIVRPAGPDPRVADVRQLVAAHGYFDVPAEVLGALAREAPTQHWNDRAVIRCLRRLLDVRLREAVQTGRGVEPDRSRTWSTAQDGHGRHADIGR